MKTYMHNSKQGDIVLINESVNKILANAMKNTNNQNLPKKVTILFFYFFSNSKLYQLITI